jgi:protocadherin Fat 4
VVTVTDVNDNPPMFETCPLSAVVQEGIQPGQALLTVVLTDSDSEDNGGRFRLELAGEGADAFSFDPLMNLITTRQLFYTHREQYDLNVIIDFKSLLIDIF